MSEPILNALMQLFAIVADVEGLSDRSRSAVRSFLDEEIDPNLAENYLKIYDQFIQHHHFRKKRKDGKVKRTSRNSVKMLRIATEINRNLTKPQKQVALIRLIEYVESQNILHHENIEFIEVIADAFNITKDVYKDLHEFVKFHADAPPCENLLVISGPEAKTYEKQIIQEGLNSVLVFTYLPTSKILAFRKLDSQDLSMGGLPIKRNRVYLMQRGVSLRVSNSISIYYSDIIKQFIQQKISDPVQFTAEAITYQFKSGEFGLHELSFTAESGQLIGVMGGSGTGKSTLLNVLNGTNEPTNGNVCINGVNLHKESQSVEGLIGFVPQDDLLIDDLTVFENLYYSACLSFGNQSKENIKQMVGQTLANLGLWEVRSLKVGSSLDKSISGGQRKRLNIALELIREPYILFVDEPTSGLSSRDSEIIMDLLKELTLKGCLVFVVIHQPSSVIFRMFDQLIFMDKGGYLVYKGNPVDGVRYFRSASDQLLSEVTDVNINPEQIFDILEARVVNEFGEFTQERKVKPIDWNQRFLGNRSGYHSPKIKVPNKIPHRTSSIPNYWKQLVTFVKRDVKSKLANRQYLLINFLETPVLALLISTFLRYSSNSGGEYIYRNNTNILSYTFISVVVALFVGLTVSAEEIIKDRKIQRREAFLNLSWAGYLNSKILILFGISAIQMFMYVMIGNTILEIKGMYFCYWIVLFTTAALSNLIGLNISASFSKVVTIYILIPFIIIPQIMFSGLLVKYERLNPWFSSQKHVPFIGNLMPTRWLYEALAVNQSINNEFDKIYFSSNQKLTQASFKKNFWIPEMESAALVLERNLKESLGEKAIEKGIIISNELEKLPAKELKHLATAPNKFKTGQYTHQDIQNLKSFLVILENYYARRLSKAVANLDKVTIQIKNSMGGEAPFTTFRNEYQNEELNNYLNNKNSLTKVSTVDGEIFNKENYTFRSPRNSSPHYYAPQKYFLGNTYSTFQFNLIVIWICTALFTIALYFKWLPRLLLDQKKT